MTKPAWAMRAATIVAALSCMIAPLNTVWSQAKFKQDKALPAEGQGTTQAGQLKAGVRAGGAPGTALAGKLVRSTATNPAF